MPNFVSSLPETSYHNAFPIVRTPARGTLRGTITSELLTCAPVHFFRNRTVPHEVDGECLACQHQLPYRWLAWIAFVETGSTAQAIFEVTATAARALERYLSAHSTVRGARFRASRPAGQRNSRIMLDVREGLPSAPALPKPPDVGQCLVHIWASNQDTPTPTQEIGPEAAEAAFSGPTPGWATVPGNGRPRTRPARSEDSPE